MHTNNSTYLTPYYYQTPSSNYKNSPRRCVLSHITLCIHQQDEVKRKTVLIWHLPNKSSFNVKRKELSKLESWLLYLPLTCSTRATRSSSFWSWVMSSKKRALKKHAYSTCLLPRCGVIYNFKFQKIAESCRPLFSRCLSAGSWNDWYGGWIGNRIVLYSRRSCYSLDRDK
jgi:hypothetical protein